ncbi:MAG: DNA repair protein RecN [Deltaproteobacteria bacterium]|nr:DNA repair protein RecN [Deltaproteobacteria bacterium]
MLSELSISNFAIIDELKVSFAGGLNVLSGETGAGKSIIIGAVTLLLGDRASSDMIRSSEDAAVVEALFDIGGNEALQETLRQRGFYEGNDLIIRRVVSRSGKNRVYINGHLATVALLAPICESLVNICSQHEHQMILNEDNHVDILDEFGGLLPLRSEYASLYDEYQSLNARLRELEAANRRKEEREELLRYQLKEISDAALSPGEDGFLAEEKTILGNMQKLMDYAAGAHETLYGKKGSVLEELKGAIACIREIKKIDAGLNVSEQDMDGLYYQLEDAALTLRDYGKKLSFDPARLDAIEERLERIGRLKRKYGGAIPDILKKGEEIAGELQGIASADAERERLAKAITEQRTRLEEKADVLSRKRKAAAKLLKGAVERDIRDLRMEEAQFEVMFSEAAVRKEENAFGSTGADTVEFYLSTNRGEDLKPLNRIASGGELSRIMLAIKKVLARTGSVGTIIFDEVDSGIGGATAEIVGEKLKEVAKHHQVLCITHLPQIACFGDRHYRVTKVATGERTNTRVEALSETERLDEITRMLGGLELTEKARQHAREMLTASRRGYRSDNGRTDR